MRSKFDRFEHPRHDLADVAELEAARQRHPARPDRPFESCPVCFAETDRGELCPSCREWVEPWPA
jgi:hypothetical protein